MPVPGPWPTSAWLGLVVGLIEVGVLLVEQLNRTDVATIGALRLNRHYPWMIPAHASLAIFVGFGLALS